MTIIRQIKYQQVNLADIKIKQHGENISIFYVKNVRFRLFRFNFSWHPKTKSQSQCFPLETETVSSNFRKYLVVLSSPPRSVISLCLGILCTFNCRRRAVFLSIFALKQGRELWHFLNIGFASPIRLSVKESRNKFEVRRLRFESRTVRQDSKLLHGM